MIADHIALLNGTAKSIIMSIVHLGSNIQILRNKIYDVSNIGYH
jgi:hypothetical protein